VQWVVLGVAGGTGGKLERRGAEEQIPVPTMLEVWAG